MLVLTYIILDICSKGIFLFSYNIMQGGVGSEYSESMLSLGSSKNNQTFKIWCGWLKTLKGKIYQGRMTDPFGFFG